MNSRNNFYTSLFVGASLLFALLSGCASAGPAISSHPDTTANYAGYKTYLMLHPHGLAPTRNPAVTPVLVHLLREEAGVAFATKGLVKSPDAYADVMILVHGGLRDKPAVRDWGLTYGRLGHVRQELETYKEGTLFVDVFDARTRELVWRGSAVAGVGGMPETAQMKATIDSIIARYPN